MRSLLSAVAGTFFALMVDVSTAAAQQPGRVYKIGWLWAGVPGVAPVPYEQFGGNGGIFRDTLRDRGYVSGRNLVVDVREAQGDVSHFPLWLRLLSPLNPI